MKRLFKWFGIAVGSLVGLLVLAVVGLYAVTGRRMARRYEVTVEAVQLAADSTAAVERGRHFAVAIGKCVACHDRDLGGMVMEDNPAFGRLVSTNLTAGRGGVAGRYSDADWERAIRHGISPEGRALIFMPSQEYNSMTDGDLADLLAYLESVPPVDRVAQKPRVGPVARALYLSGVFPLLPVEQVDHEQKHLAARQPEATVEYGRYMAIVGGCTGCHMADLAGGGGPPPGAPNLTPAGAIAGWTEQDFVTALRVGKRPDGTAISAAMPWAYTAQLSDLEMKALWLYVSSVPPKESPK